MRTIIQVTGRNGNTFDATIPGMNVMLAVFPFEIVPEHLWKFVNPGQRFFARVTETDDGTITVTDFELAPDPDPIDGLG